MRTADDVAERRGSHEMVATRRAGGLTLTVIGLLCLLAATVCVACAFINKE